MKKYLSAIRFFIIRVLAGKDVIIINADIGGAAMINVPKNRLCLIVNTMIKAKSRTEAIAFCLSAE